MKRFASEFVATFFLIFCGTGAIVINQFSHGHIGHMGVAISFGLVVTILIYAFRHISGAHINPAVSLAFCLTDRFESKLFPIYFVAQCLGAIAASLVLSLMFPTISNLGHTFPAASWQQSFMLEIFLSYFLMLVILMVSQTESVTQYTAPAVGGVVLLEALFAGPVSGASMNPARSLGPALVSGELEHLWIYFLAPAIGMCLASFTWMYFDKNSGQ